MAETLSERLVVRVSARVMNLLLEVSEGSELTVSEWVRGAVEQQAVREVQRLVPEPRHLGWSMTPVGLCLHPLTARVMLPHEVKCSLCGAVVKSL